MPPDPDRPRGRAPRLVSTLSVLVGLALVAGASVAGYRALTWAEPPIRVRVRAAGIDRWVQLPEGQPVSAALVAAGVHGRDGVLRSAGTGGVLDAAADPARIALDGAEATPDTRLRAGDVVAVADGVDSVEDTVVVEQDLPAPPLPDVMRHVQEAGAPGRGEQVVGVRSGEVVSTKVLVEPIAPKQTERKVVALTFDDGPSVAWTQQVLAVLAEKHVHATFCEVGDNVTNHPDLAKQVVAEGHLLCNHTKGHDEGLRGAPQEQLDTQIAGGRAAFAENDLPAPRWFRPPGGFLDDGIIATVQAQGEQVIHWKVDTEDWKAGTDPFTIVRHVVDQVEPGAIVLMHDGGGKDRSATIAALGGTIDLLRGQGYEFTFPVIDRPAA